MTGGVSDGLEILAGVPQGFIHDILAFKMFIDDTRNDLKVLILAWYLCNQRYNMPENFTK